MTCAAVLPAASLSFSSVLLCICYRPQQDPRNRSSPDGRPSNLRWKSYGRKSQRIRSEGALARSAPFAAKQRTGHAAVSFGTVAFDGGAPAGRSGSIAGEDFSAQRPVNVTRRKRTATVHASVRGPLSANSKMRLRAICKARRLKRQIAPSSVRNKCGNIR